MKFPRNHSFGALSYMHEWAHVEGPLWRWISLVMRLWKPSKAPYTLSVKLNDFTLWRHTQRKNCATLTDTSAGLRTALSGRLSHRELRSSLRKSHSFLILPADSTMASPQGTSVSSNSFSTLASHDIFLFKYHYLLHILRLLFFSDSTIADVTSKQQTTALFLSTIVTRTRRHTELTKKLTNLMGNLCYVREHSVQFFVQFFNTVKPNSLTWECRGPFRLEAAMYRPSDRAEEWHKYVCSLLLIEMRNINCITYITNVITVSSNPSCKASIFYPAYEVNNLGRISVDMRRNGILLLLVNIDHQGHTHDQRLSASS